MRRICATSGCPDEPLPGRSMCATHAAEQRKGNRSVNDSWYASRPWRLSRRAYLFDHPLCEYVLENGQECGRIADSVHHRTPIEDGGARRDPANLMSTCRPHHSMIHAAMRRTG